MAEPEPVKLEGIRIAGLQFLPSEGGASLLVPQAVIDSLTRQVVEQRSHAPTPMRVARAIAELREQIYVLTGVQI